MSGLPKGDYYRKAILGQEVMVTAGNYMSNRVAKVLEQILGHLKNGNTEDEKLLLELVKKLVKIGQMKMPLLATGTFQKQSKLLTQFTLNIKRTSLFTYTLQIYYNRGFSE